MTPNPRYDGQPMLRLLEFYVLWSIGQLSDADEKTVIAMTPMLQAAHRAQGRWHEVIAASLRLPADMPDAIRGMWARNTEIARQNGATLTPQQFAEMFVDKNFAD